MTGPIWELPDEITLSLDEARTIYLALHDAELATDRDDPLHHAAGAARRVLQSKLWPELDDI